MNSNRLASILGLIWAMGVVGQSQVIFTTDQLIGAGDTPFDGQVVIINKCTVTVNGFHRFDSLLLTNGAVLTHSPAPNGEAEHQIHLMIARTMSVDASSRIDVSSRGYGGTSGKGAGPGGGAGTRSDTNGGGGGGAHGGNGGLPQSPYVGGGAYGAWRDPVEWGSAGGAGYAGAGGAGGGVIRIEVGGLAQLDGEVLANGANGPAHSYGAAGGGAGGSIWIAAAELTGSGTVRADGGAGSVVSEEDGGGGGGGRISLEAGANRFSGSVIARGGSGYQHGGAGTVFARGATGVRGDLRVANGAFAGAATPVQLVDPLAVFWIATNARVEWSGSAILAAEAMVLSSTGRLDLVQGSTLGALDWLVHEQSMIVCYPTNESGTLSNRWEGRGATLLARQFTLSSNSSITADGFGYAGTPTRGNGPGGGFGAVVDAAAGAGGSYGGVGGDGQVAGYTAFDGYGLVVRPVDLGSGGGAAYAGAGGSGGGAIHLVVTNELVLEGSLTARGAAGRAHSWGSSGGGAGGSIWIEAGEIRGSGLVSVDGGTAPAVAEEDGGGGGGGRIAIHAGVDLFAGRLSAVGGGGWQTGGAGTILRVFPGAPLGELRMDNASRMGQRSVIAPEVRVNALVLTNGARWDLLGGLTWNVAERLTISSNGWVVCFTTNRSDRVDGEWRGAGVTISADEITITEGGVIHADGEGYTSTTAAGNGPGGGSGINNESAGGGGGGHGGEGGRPQSPFSGGRAYGELKTPVTPGSAGGAGYAGRGGNGGGAIHLEALRVIVDGRLSAQGIAGASHNYGAAGGGGGGSIWIEAGTVAGTGVISVTGGNSAVVAEEDGGGGAGGRIAIDGVTNQFAGVYGIEGGLGFQRGGAGTLFLKSPHRPAGVLVVRNEPGSMNDTPWDARDRLDEILIEPNGRVRLSGTEVRQAGSIEVLAGAELFLSENATLAAEHLRVASNGVVRCVGMNTSALVDGIWQGRGVRLRLGGLALEEGGIITANGAGYTGTMARGNGPGGGGGARNESAGGGGAGHGGNGGLPGSSYAAGSAYGSITEPLALGSAGGAGFAGQGANGGGAIQLMVTNQLALDGMLRADGEHGLAHSYGAAGGGAGGSIWIETGNLSGNGVLSANGGNGALVSEEDSGSGAGGRIAIYYSVNSFAGGVEALGGTGGRSGAAGTVFWKSQAQAAGLLRVDNGGRDGAETPWLGEASLDELFLAGRARLTALSSNSYFAREVEIANEGILALSGASTLVCENLWVKTNGVLNCGAIYRTGLLDGAWAGVGSTILAGDAIVEVGGRITADETGYSATSSRGNGPGGGAGAQNESGGGGGGGHGGPGQGGQGYAGGLAYGEEPAPVALGSAGGAGYAGPGGAGGGAIRLVVTNALIVEGSITARGGDGPAHGYGAAGGGAGGSIWISAGTISGTGNLLANGGQGLVVAEEDGGCGGGGRIALHALTNAFLGMVQARGGTRYETAGAGTMHTNVTVACTVTPVRPLVLSGLAEFIVRFNRPVNGLVADDLVIANAAIVEWSGGGAEYRAQLRPIEPGAVTLRVTAGAVEDAGVPSDASNVGLITYALPLVLLTQPMPVQVPVGGTATFGVNVSGTGPISYLWLKNGNPTSAVGSSFTMTNIVEADAGAYSVRVTSPYGTLLSDTAELRIGEVLAPAHLVAHLDSEGRLVLELDGGVGLSYAIEWAPSLGTTARWTTASSLVLPAGHGSWTDPEPAVSTRFYRAIQLQP